MKLLPQWDFFGFWGNGAYRVVPDVPIGTSGTANKTPSLKVFIFPNPNKSTQTKKNDVVPDVPLGTTGTENKTPS